jgi:putative N-acetylmannosamine-6-phosphate epimerase
MQLKIKTLRLQDRFTNVKFAVHHFQKNGNSLVISMCTLENLSSVKFAISHSHIKVALTNTDVYILRRSVINVTAVVNVSQRKVILIGTDGRTQERSLSNVKFAIIHSHRKEVLILIDVCILERSISSVKFVVNILLVQVI